MIIKIEAVPKLTEDNEILLDAKRKPVWDKERAFVTSKDGK